MQTFYTATHCLVLEDVFTIVKRRQDLSQTLFNCASVDKGDKLICDDYPTTGFLNQCFAIISSDEFDRVD